VRLAVVLGTVIVVAMAFVMLRRPRPTEDVTEEYEPLVGHDT
jgi:hypothetical protein